MNAPSRISDDTRAVLTQVALDYAEGWYEGDAERMARSLHDSLIKRTIIHSDDPCGWAVGPISDKPSLVGWTADGDGRNVPGERVYEVDILDVFRDIATVRCLSLEYVDHLQIAKFGDDGWKIVNVLWQLRTGDFTPASA